MSKNSENVADFTNSQKSSQSNINVQIPARTERKNTRGTRQSAIDSTTNKFLRNFDPEHSEREKRKLHRRLYQGNRKHVLYDDKGTYIQTGDNICDCLNQDCTGCHFPCPKCSSLKCGHECRNNRKWTYESVENEGSDYVIKNPLLKET